MNRSDEEVDLTGWDEDSRAGSITVHTSDGAIFEVAPSAPELKGLALGSPLSAQQLAALGFAATRKQVAKSALKLLNRRFYSSSRLRTRLVQRDFPPDAVDAVLGELARQGLLDDRRFAQAWCHDQLVRRPVGPRWLRSGLRGQGVADDAIEDALASLFSGDREREACGRALATRHYSLNDEKGRARAMRFLASRGFSASLARELVFEASERLEAREEDA